MTPPGMQYYWVPRERGTTFDCRFEFIAFRSVRTCCHNVTVLRIVDAELIDATSHQE
jgi:hypothetical protein